jgi:hypothetical protein
VIDRDGGEVGTVGGDEGDRARHGIAGDRHHVVGRGVLGAGDGLDLLDLAPTAIRPTAPSGTTPITSTGRPVLSRTGVTDPPSGSHVTTGSGAVASSTAPHRVPSGRSQVDQTPATPYTPSAPFTELWGMGLFPESRRSLAES